LPPEPVPMAPPTDAPTEEVTPVAEPPVALPPLEPPTDVNEEVTETPTVNPNLCRAPDGVSARPRNLTEAVTLMNSLPRPTTLPCFLEALERPLQVYMTRSDQSLQPSPGVRSPRTFIINEPMVMSIVFEGEAHVTLELGYRTAETRSIKTELVFPLVQDVTFDTLFDHVKEGIGTRCGNCHTGEEESFNDEIQAIVYESDLYPPFEVYEVDLESVRAESTSCDAATEPDRCALLSGLFDHGDVVAAPQGLLFSL
jgi:hypothetical protein